MGSAIVYMFHVGAVLTFMVVLSTGLANSKRHPYDFVKPLSDSSDSIRGPSAYSYSNSRSSSLINSNKRPALSILDLDTYKHEDKQRSLSSESSSSNTLFENVPLPPISDEDDGLKQKEKNEHMGDFNARLSTTKIVSDNAMRRERFKDKGTQNPASFMDRAKVNGNADRVVIGDTTRDNRRRVVIPLSYRNKRRRINDKDGDEDIEEKEGVTKSSGHIESSALNQITNEASSEHMPSVQISISDFKDPQTTTTQRPTIITSSSIVDNKSPAFASNIKDDNNIKTNLLNMDTDSTIRDPLALPLHAEDLKNWGLNRLYDDNEAGYVDEVQTESVKPKASSTFSDSNMLFADGDIYSRLQKHKQVFTSRKGQKHSEIPSLHNVQSRELPRTSPNSQLQDMEYSGSSQTNVTKQPNAQPYRRYKSGYKDDYYYYDYDYDNEDYLEDDYVYGEYDGGLSRFQNNAVRRNSKPNQKPKYKSNRRMPASSSPVKSRYTPSSPTNLHRLDKTSSPISNLRRSPSLGQRNPYLTQGEGKRFQNHRLSSQLTPKSLNRQTNYESKSLTSSDKYRAYGYSPNTRLTSSQLLKKSNNKRQGVIPGNYQTSQGVFGRPSKSQYSSVPSSSIASNNPRRLNSQSNRNRPFTSPGLGASGVGLSGVRGPALSSSTRR